MSEELLTDGGAFVLCIMIPYWKSRKINRNLETGGKAAKVEWEESCFKIVMGFMRCDLIIV